MSKINTSVRSVMKALSIQINFSSIQWPGMPGRQSLLIGIQMKVNKNVATTPQRRLKPPTAYDMGLCEKKSNQLVGLLLGSGAGAQKQNCTVRRTGTHKMVCKPENAGVHEQD